MKTRSRSATYLEQVNRAIDHIVQNLDQPLRLWDVAQVTSISPFHFHRVFQAIVGETPAEFGRRLRLERALKRMAYGGRRSLTSIALECGFRSSSDFSRCFKKRYGAAPRDFDLNAWTKAHGDQLAASVEAASYHLKRLPSRRETTGFPVRIVELARRQVAYIRVARPYVGDRVLRATQRLLTWAERNGFEHGQWLGYQWEIPEITALEDCHYYVAVEARGFTPRGEIGRHSFPAMRVAQIEIKGGIDLELQALQWLYRTWLPHSRYVPDDQPGFESWIGRPFAHGTDYFEIHVQIPIRSR